MSKGATRMCQGEKKKAGVRGAGRRATVASYMYLVSMPAHTAGASPRTRTHTSYSMREPHATATARTVKVSGLALGRFLNEQMYTGNF